MPEIIEKSQEKMSHEEKLDLIKELRDLVTSEYFFKWILVL